MEINCSKEDGAFKLYKYFRYGVKFKLFIVDFDIS